GYPFGNIVQLLIVTGQRRDEVAGMRWQDLDLTEKVWTIPGANNKSGRIHSVPLSPQVLEIIKKLPRVHDKLLFPAKGKDHHVNGWSRWKAKMDNMCKVNDWTLHDLRRTAATGMAKLDVEPHIIGRIMNHAQGGVAGIYNRYQYLPKMRT